MSNTVAIVTDSTCDLPADVVAKHQIHVVPQHILWGTESYLDGVDITSDVFYERLATAKETPQTSQPSVADFAEAYQTAREANNADSVLCITLSHNLSGTNNSAKQAVSQVEFPVEVIDARTASQPLGFVVLSAAEARDEGATLAEIVKVARDTVGKVQIYFTVGDLEFLHRGGRVGGAKRLIGDALKIKPILSVKAGMIAPKESVRTRRRVIKRLIDLVAEDQQGKIIKRLGVVHGDAQEEAEELISILKPRFNVEKVYLNTCCSAVGTHVGPGVIGVAYQLG